MALIILNQILIMSLFMLIGYLLFRAGKITEEGSRSMANVLAWVVIPCNILSGFMTEYSAKRLSEMGISLLLGAFTIFFAAFISAILFRGNGIEQFAATFSNAGFIGIPLIRAAIGEEGVFYLTGLLVTFNILQWVRGFHLLREGSWLGRDENPADGGRKKNFAAALLRNPMVIASVVGFLIFVLRLGTRLPSVISGCVDGLMGLNAPLAMIVLGVYLAQSDIPSLFVSKRLYFVSAARLILIPLLTILIMAPLPVDNHIKMTMIIAGSAPVGANVAVYSQLLDTDYVYACRTVTQSTLLSIVIMPLMMYFASVLIPV